MKLLALAMIFALAGAPAFARCKTVEKLAADESIRTERLQMRADGCSHSFAIARPVEASIVEKPEHGILDRFEAAAFGYFPHAGYKGPDAYAVKVCGPAACTTVRFEATIR